MVAILQGAKGNRNVPSPWSRGVDKVKVFSFAKVLKVVVSCVILRRRRLASFLDHLGGVCRSRRDHVTDRLDLYPRNSQEFTADLGSSPPYSNYANAHHFSALEGHSDHGF
jgi:hypothetical protein